MAKVDATAFKVQTAAMAAALTIALRDDTLDEVALDFRNAKHPIRKIDKLFNFNPATGLVSSDDAYVDAVYAGDSPNKSNPFDVQGVPIPLALVSASVEDAAPTDIILTWSFAVSQAQNIGLNLGRSVVSVSNVTVVMTIETNTPYVNTDTILISGLFGYPDNYVELINQAVTNNVAA